MALSFSFKKKIESKLVAPAEIQDSEKSEESSSKPSQSKSDTGELVIPLIKRNIYHMKAATIQNHKATSKDGLEEEAAKEIIKETKHFLEQSTDDTENFDDLEIPLLLKNKVPEGFETDDKLDVSLRPDEATEAQYDQIPVSAFGLAVLRGMGWTPEVGIGKTFKQNTKTLEQKIRPKGLGLGADTSSAQISKNPKSASATNGVDESEVLDLVKGSKILVSKGSHKNKYGTIIGVDVDADRFVIKMAIGGKVERIGQHCIKAVSKKEYDSNAKDLSRLSKAYTGKSVTIIDDSGPSQQRGNVEHRKKTRERDPHSPQPEEKRRKKDKYDDAPNKHKTRDNAPNKHKKSSNIKPHEATWVRPQIRVRIVDKKYRKGRYYREKVVVEDILGHGKCCCKTDDGKILDDINDSMLETVIPKSSSEAYVIIVHSRKGRHNGKLAKILEKDKDKCTAMLQLIDDRDVVLEVGFEDMCEFAGDPEMNAMF